MLILPLPTPALALRVAGGFALAGVGGYVFSLLHVPLAWMIGSLVVTAGTHLAGVGLPIPRGSRYVGQVIVGTAMGLYFTPPTVAALAADLPTMVVAAVLLMALGFATAALLGRLARIDGVTAFFSCMPGGAMEMAILSERYGGRIAPVALAQLLRVAVLVMVVPPAVIWSGIAGRAEFVQHVPGVSYPGLAALFALCAVAAFAAARLGVSNGCLLGALAFSAVLTGLEVHLSEIPFPVLALGQVLLGSALGALFDRAFLARAWRFACACLAATVFLIAVCAGSAFAMAALSGLPLATLVLATAPGGVAEMSVTARALHLNVAYVAAFHVVRLFVILPATPFVFEAARRFLPGRWLAPERLVGASDD